jgi:hypothetical protein
MLYTIIQQTGIFTARKRNGGVQNRIVRLQALYLKRLKPLLLKNVYSRRNYTWAVESSANAAWTLYHCTNNTWK